MKADSLSPRWRLLSSVACGAVLPLSLAPFHLWWLAPLALALGVFLLQENNGRRLWWHSYGMMFGLFAVGTSWIYVSIHDYGYAPVPLAAFLTLLFVAGLALLFAPPLWCYGRYFRGHPVAALLAFPCLWVLGEWYRSWLLTGFPWLYLGYAHVDTVLAGWLPLGGVYTASWITAFCGAALWYGWQYRRFRPLACALLLFGSGWALQQVHWTDIDRTAPIRIGIVQPNFSQHEKWNPAYREAMHNSLRQLSSELWQEDVVVWPEAALPELLQEAIPFLASLPLQQESLHHSALVTGVLTYDEERSSYRQPVVYNSVVALGNGEGLYHKVRLVPFGEYVPLERWLRGLIRFFDLPTSHMSRGDDAQAPLLVAGKTVAPFVCYEIVYPDLVARNSRRTDWLLTVSNDSWFGDSLGPQQHLQMVQARAVESGRYVVRGTNDGISAIIDPQGRLQLASTRFTSQSLRGVVYPARGSTPYMQFASLPLISALLLLLLLLLALERWRAKPQSA